MLFLFITTLVSSAGFAALPSESVRSGGTAATGTKGQSDCKAPFCLPKHIVDDDPTMTAKAPDCNALGTVLGTANNSDFIKESKACMLTGSNDDGPERRKIAKLHNCLEQVRKILPDDYDAQKQAITKFPSARLKTFLGMILTSYGETVASMKIQDHLAVMKVIDNRTRECVNGKKTQATSWEIATAPVQFSMYNKKIYSHSKDRFIKNEEKSPERMNLAIQAFLKMQCASFDPEKSWNEAQHYKADYVSPSWAKASKLISGPQVNEQPLASTKPYHQFYTNQWECNFDEPGHVQMASLDVRRSPLLMLMFENANAKTNTGKWEVVRFPGKGTYLRSKAHPLIQSPMMTDSSLPVILSVKAHTRFPHLEMIAYDAGEFGTTQIVRVTRVVVFNTKTQKIVGDYPLSYRAALGPVPDQPKWSSTPTEIRIENPETGSVDFIRTSAD